MPTLDDIRAWFSGDRYAVELTGVHIDEALPGQAVCTLPLRPELLNANHKPMGGAIFTLADFAFAVAVNGHSQTVTVSQHIDITFLAPAKGSLLTARAACLKAGRQTCLYSVDVTDELGTYVAHATVNGHSITTPPLQPLPQA